MSFPTNMPTQFMKRISETRRDGGKLSQRAGSNLQKAILTSAQVSKHVKIIELPPLGARYVGGAKLKTEKICFDFIGAQMGGGRGIFIDGKSSEDMVGLDIRNPKTIPPHQVSSLLSMRECGAIAGFLIEARHPGNYFWLDVLTLIQERKEKRVAEWAGGAMWPMGRITRLVDFMELIRLYTRSGV